MIDRTRCTASRNARDIGGSLCQELATHQSHLGRRCALHAEELKRALRNPSTFIGVIKGRAFTEEEIARIVVELREASS